MLTAIDFPNLASEGFTPRSPITPKYNCIAWAAGENRRWWSPHLLYYWPPGVQRTNSIEAYIEAFASIGYAPCADDETKSPLHEPGFVRIALYASSGAPKHAARQIDATIWTSKLGQNMDVEHTLRALEGPAYGFVVKILRKPN